ncbi:hypothetical protein CQ018_08145 [Arthrobacter sp. MYb227]|uniref:SdpI family protein n=1 Tax=Arthrobacter sp. MYb227 TaxID=1848601 RepID=UPI000CFB47A2|nr:SdpI family protein [Arthrobacter sp. MYb227]PQZ93626.1 hypothetical protein CQ018_08145 [Arthrobacter sp. MYb227]
MQPLPLVAWVFTTLLCLLLGVALAASRGSIPINHFLGIRIPALKRSEAAWRAGHRATIIPTALALVLSLVFSILGLLDPLAYAGTIIVFVCAVIWTFIAASKAARAQ